MPRDESNIFCLFWASWVWYAAVVVCSVILRHAEWRRARIDKTRSAKLEFAPKVAPSCARDETHDSAGLVSLLYASRLLCHRPQRHSNLILEAHPYPRSFHTEISGIDGVGLSYAPLSQMRSLAFSSVGLRKSSRLVRDSERPNHTYHIIRR